MPESRCDVCALGLLLLLIPLPPATLYPLYMLAGCPNYFEAPIHSHTHTQTHTCIVFQASHVRIELNLQQNVAKGGWPRPFCLARLLSIFSNVFSTYVCVYLCECAP